MMQCSFERQTNQGEIYFCIADVGHAGDHVPYRLDQFIGQWRPRTIPPGATRATLKKNRRKETGHGVTDD